MKRRVDEELDLLKKHLIEMADAVKGSLNTAIEGLKKEDTSGMQMIRQLEDRINQMHKEIDESCVRILAQYSPLAADLRLTTSVLKIGHELERMGDLAKTISYNAKDFVQKKAEQSVPEGIVEMTSFAKQMLEDAIHAFVQRDQGRAGKVLSMDNELDQRRDHVIQTLVHEMTQSPTKIPASLHLVFIAKNLERIGDHATNIAEDVIYVSTGRDVRHNTGFTGG